MSRTRALPTDWPDPWVKPRNRYQRAVQVLRWAKTEFPLDRLKRLEWEAELKDEDGEDLCGCVEEEDDGSLTIKICPEHCPTVSTVIDTLLHEAAHAELWSVGLGRLHGPRFHEAHGRIADAYEHHGHLDSRTFPVE